jgi:hypothetical protein
MNAHFTFAFIYVLCRSAQLRLYVLVVLCCYAVLTAMDPTYER